MREKERDREGERRRREREKEREREISATHHFTWHPRPVTFWADCTAARSGTVRLPLQSASYCNTPPHLCPSRTFPSVPFSAVAAVVVVPASSSRPFFLPLFFRSFPSARSASSPTLHELYLRRLSRCPHAVLWDLDGAVPLVLHPLMTSRGVNVKIICPFSCYKKEL